MTPIWQSLFTNLALVSILVGVWDLQSDVTGRFSERMQSLLLGLTMSIGSIASMATAQPFVPGFIFDLRSPLIAAAGFFGGWPAAAVAAAGAVSYRLYLGGQGAVTGVVGIIIASSVGLAFHWIVRSREKTTGDIFKFGVAVAVGSLLNLLTIPSAIMAGVIARTWLPLSSLTFVGAVMIGILLNRQFRGRELANTNMIYRAMVRELPDSLNVKDSAGLFLAANPATAILMRAGSADDLIGKSDFDFYPHGLAERFRRDELAMIQTGAILRVDQPALFPDGTEGWLATLKVPLRDEAGSIVGIITYNRDITEQKRNAQLKNEFISTVSHELRTPLTSIRGSLGLIAAGVTGELPPKAANLVRIAHTNSERLVLLINDILDMEKIESGKMAFELRRLPIRPILEQAIAANANYLPDRDVKIVLVDDAPRAEANVDPDRLHQVFINLLSNAIKFSPVGETVTVELGRRDENWMRVSVIDRGAGIPEAFRKRIFGKFEQADASSTREKGGTGLGLSIAKSIVEKLGGTIGFETEDSGGTVFHVDLPEIHSKETTPAGTVDLLAPIDHRTRVLICEDEGDISAVIAALLDAEGFSSDVAPDIASAKALLQIRQYAALTLDIKLAGESGIKLFRDIRASPHNPEIPVIVISAVADETKRSLNGSAVGIVDWLEKPVDPERLHMALGKIATRRIDRRPRVLHVEDDEGVLEVMSEGLGPDVSITFARTLREGQYAISSHHFDLMILDIALPDGSGLDLLSDLPSETAVIVFSAADVDEKLGSRVKAIMTKTKASELDVAKLVKSLLPVTQSDSSSEVSAGK